MKGLGMILLALFCIFVLACIIYLIITIITYHNNQRLKLTSSLNNLNFKYWTTISSSGILFPEQCSSSLYGNNVPNLNKVSIGISGGGSRSVASTIGYFRALNRMGYKNKAQYISSASGGSWFYGTYSFYQSKFSDDLILGSSSGLNKNGIPDPSLMTVSKLSSDNNTNTKYLGYILNNAKPYEIFIANLTNKNIPYDDAFCQAIGSVFLEPYGLNANVPIAVNLKHAQDIQSRNTSIGSPLYLPNNMPFWLCATSLLFEYISTYPMVLTTLTPLYSGLTQTITKNNNKIGGAVIENYAFGATTAPNIIIPSANNNCSSNEYTARLLKTKNIKTLRDMMGASGCAYAPILYRIASIFPKESKEIIPKYNIWGTSSSNTISDSQCTLNLLTNKCDGPSGYDSNTCTKINKCYSNTAPQCTNNSQCKFNLSSLECKNTNPSNSSLNCVTNSSFLNPTGCKCTQTTPINTLSNLYIQQAQLGDGGYIDQLGVLALVARGVKHIISFQASDDFCLHKQLFGVISDITCIPNFIFTQSGNAQIFKSSDLDDCLNQFNDNYNKGGPIFARQKLAVLPNTDNGIKGGYTVDILFVFQYAVATRFYNALPLEVRNEITKNPLLPGKFDSFPTYSVLELAPSLGKVNILSSYTDWCLNQPELKPHIVEMFNYY